MSKLKRYIFNKYVYWALGILLFPIWLICWIVGAYIFIKFVFPLLFLILFA